MSYNYNSDNAFELQYHSEIFPAGIRDRDIDVFVRKCLKKYRATGEIAISPAWSIVHKDGDPLNFDPDNLACKGTEFGLCGADGKPCGSIGKHSMAKWRDDEIVPPAPQPITDRYIKKYSGWVASQNWNIVLYKCNPIKGALDADPKSGGLAALAEFEKRFGPVPYTLTTETGDYGPLGIGLHKYVNFTKDGKLFKDALDWPGKTDIAKELGFGAGLELLTNQVMLPPSIHRTGKRYRFLPGQWFDDTTDIWQGLIDATVEIGKSKKKKHKKFLKEISKTNKKLAEEIEKLKYESAKNRWDLETRAKNYIVKWCRPSIKGQDGSGALFRVACVLMIDFAFSFPEAWNIIQWYNQTMCQPRWSDKELEHKLQDAAKKPGPHGRLLETWKDREERELREFEQAMDASDDDVKRIVKWGEFADKCGNDGAAAPTPHWSENEEENWPEQAEQQVRDGIRADRDEQAALQSEISILNAVPQNVPQNKHQRYHEKCKHLPRKVGCFFIKWLMRKDGRGMYPMICRCGSNDCAYCYAYNKLERFDNYVKHFSKEKTIYCYTVATDDADTFIDYIQDKEKDYMGILQPNGTTAIFTSQKPHKLKKTGTRPDFRTFNAQDLTQLKKLKKKLNETIEAIPHSLLMERKKRTGAKIKPWRNSTNWALEKEESSGEFLPGKPGGTDIKKNFEFADKVGFKKTKGGKYHRGGIGRFLHTPDYLVPLGGEKIAELFAAWLNAYLLFDILPPNGDIRHPVPDMNPDFSPNKSNTEYSREKSGFSREGWDARSPAPSV